VFIKLTPGTTYGVRNAGNDATQNDPGIQLFVPDAAAGVRAVRPCGELDQAMLAQLESLYRERWRRSFRARRGGDGPDMVSGHRFGRPEIGLGPELGEEP